MPVRFPSLDHCSRFFMRLKENETLPAVVGWAHVVKTSGFSTYNALFPDIRKRVATYPTLHAANGIGENWASGCPVSHWHCTPSEMAGCKGARDARWLTVLRDPVDRVLSEYYFMRAKRNYLGWTPSMIAKRDNLSAWALDDYNTAHNRQAFYALYDGAYPLRGTCAPTDANKTTAFILGKVGSFAAFNRDSAIAAEALRRCAQLFFFVVIYDARAQSYDRLHHLYRLRARPTLTTHPSYQPVAEPSIRALIRSRNRLDDALLQHARKHYLTGNP